jgi:hypothetical protein
VMTLALFRGRRKRSILPFNRCAFVFSHFHSFVEFSFLFSGRRIFSRTFRVDLHVLCTTFLTR